MAWPENLYLSHYKPPTTGHGWIMISLRSYELLLWLYLPAAISKAGIVVNVSLCLAVYECVSTNITVTFMHVKRCNVDHHISGCVSGCEYFGRFVCSAESAKSHYVISTNARTYYFNCRGWCDHTADGIMLLILFNFKLQSLWRFWRHIMQI